MIDAGRAENERERCGVGMKIARTRCKMLKTTRVDEFLCASCEKNGHLYEMGERICF